MGSGGQELGQEPSEIGPQEDPYQYLDNLLGQEWMRNLEGKEWGIQLTKFPNAVGEELITVIITEPGETEPREEYVLDHQGVGEMSFKYPPLTDVPQAPTDIPEQMDDAQLDQLARERGEKVAEFVQSQLWHRS